MNLTNDSYSILISTKTSTERYYRDNAGWVKVSTRGRTFRATAEQVLNHVLPVLAGSNRASASKWNITLRRLFELERGARGTEQPEADSSPFGLGMTGPM